MAVVAKWALDYFNPTETPGASFSADDGPNGYHLLVGRGNLVDGLAGDGGMAREFPDLSGQPAATRWGARSPYSGIDTTAMREALHGSFVLSGYLRRGAARPAAPLPSIARRSGPSSGTTYAEITGASLNLAPETLDVLLAFVEISGPGHLTQGITAPPGWDRIFTTAAGSPGFHYVTIGSDPHLVPAYYGSPGILAVWRKVPDGSDTTAATYRWGGKPDAERVRVSAFRIRNAGTIMGHAGVYPFTMSGPWSYDPFEVAPISEADPSAVLLTTVTDWDLQRSSKVWEGSVARLPARGNFVDPTSGGIMGVYDAEYPYVQIAVNPPTYGPLSGPTHHGLFQFGDAPRRGILPRGLISGVVGASAHLTDSYTETMRLDLAGQIEPEGNPLAGKAITVRTMVGGQATEVERCIIGSRYDGASDRTSVWVWWPRYGTPDTNGPPPEVGSPFVIDLRGGPVAVSATDGGINFDVAMSEGGAVQFIGEPSQEVTLTAAVCDPGVFWGLVGAAGNFMIAEVKRWFRDEIDADPILEAPAGWSQLDVAGNGGRYSKAIFWRFVGPDDVAGATYTWRWTRSAFAIATVYKFVNVDPNDPFDGISPAFTTVPHGGTGGRYYDAPPLNLAHGGGLLGGFVATPEYLGPEPGGTYAFHQYKPTVASDPWEPLGPTPGPAVWSQVLFKWAAGTGLYEDVTDGPAFRIMAIGLRRAAIVGLWNDDPSHHNLNVSVSLDGRLLIAYQTSDETRGVSIASHPVFTDAPTYFAVVKELDEAGMATWLLYLGDVLAWASGAVANYTGGEACYSYHVGGSKDAVVLDEDVNYLVGTLDNLALETYVPRPLGPAPAAVGASLEGALDALISLAGGSASVQATLSGIIVTAPNGLGGGAAKASAGLFGTLGSGIAIGGVAGAAAGLEGALAVDVWGGSADAQAGLQGAFFVVTAASMGDAAIEDIWFDAAVEGADRIITSGGDWRMVGGEEALRQSLIRRLITNPGDWRTRPDFGVGALLYVGARNTRAAQDELAARVRAQFARDPRVAKVSSVQVTIGRDGIVTVRVDVLPRSRALTNSPLRIAVGISR